MAKRTLNRRQLRQDAEAAEKLQPDPAAEPAVEGEAPKKKAAAPRKPKAPGAPRPKRVPKKKEPVRMRARWGVFDGAMKQVAVFDYSQRGAADQKLADLNAKKGGVSYFLQVVKEPMPAPPPPPAAAPTA